MRWGAYLGSSRAVESTGTSCAMAAGLTQASAAV
jgi:hypothetical protein